MVVSQHVETEVISGRRLGRRVSDPLNQRLQAKLTGIVPAHPVAVDHFSEITTWGELGNDRFGDCGPAAVAHYVMLVTKYLTGTMVSPSLNDVLALYRLCNPTFDPTTGVGDNGVDMGQMLGFVCSDGIGGKKAKAHATVQINSVNDIDAVVAIFGGALLGLDMQVAQQAQTNSGGPWDYQPSAQWGGHAVLAGRYTGSPAGSDIAVVTWGEVIGTTDAFEQHQVTEVHVLIFEEHLGSVAFQQGVDLAALAADYEALTGQPFPSTPTPTPAPPAPVVSAADRALAAAIPPAWLSHPLRHLWEGQQVAVALEQWLQATGQG